MKLPLNSDTFVLWEIGEENILWVKYFIKIYRKDSTWKTLPNTLGMLIRVAELSISVSS